MRVTRTRSAASAAAEKEDAPAEPPRLAKSRRTAAAASAPQSSAEEKRAETAPPKQPSRRMLSVGDAVPDFSVELASGKHVSLADLRRQAKILVVYAYPKALTPGCTQESKDFAALQPEFENVGAAILGVSRDSVSLQQKFRAKENLGFDLCADTDSNMLNAFGSIQMKNMYGRQSLGIVRSTFLVDCKTGKVARVWPKVSVKGHAKEVLEAVKSLV